MTTVRAGMSEDDIRDRVSLDREWLPVQPTPGSLTLVEAAVDHGSAPVLLQHELAARDGACGTKKRQGGNHGGVCLLMVGGCRYAHCGDPERVRARELGPHR
jgi:hypothetical protein